MLAELLQLAEATMVATTLSIGIVATGSSIISGTAPPDLSTFITSVQLYNQNGDIVAVGNLSKPLKKNFSSEATIKVKLTY